MIVTLTLNPSVDRTVDIDALVRGEVMRARSVHVDPGGKGINVARALTANGTKARAIVVTGGAEGCHLSAMLAAQHLDVVEVPVAEAIRSNVAVVEPDGTTTKFNEPGARLTEAELAQFVDTAVEAASGAEWVLASGSLPPGVPPEFYASLTRRLAASGAKVAIDTSGAALVAAASARPALVKPNHHELAEAVGATVSTFGDVVEAAAVLRRAGVRTVLASLGGDGAILVDDTGTYHGTAPRVVPLSTVGAGDAMLAGFLADGGQGPEALVTALAWGTAAVQLPGSAMPAPHQISRTQVRVDSAPDLSRSLSEGA